MMADDDACADSYAIPVGFLQICPKRIPIRFV